MEVSLELRQVILRHREPAFQEREASLNHNVGHRDRLPLLFDLAFQDSPLLLKPPNLFEAIVKLKDQVAKLGPPKSLLYR